MRVYVDSDGVIYDFDQAAGDILGCDPRQFEDENGSDEFWARLRESGDFYLNLPLKRDALELMEYLAPLRPWVLTGSPSFIPEGHFHKQEAFKRDFGPLLPVITCQSRFKSNYCVPGDRIIDDYEKHREAWEEAGGVWVTHTSTEETIRILEADLAFKVRHSWASFWGGY
jgi:hypothetical protein